MRIVLMGPPGAGKGTQAKNIADKYKIPHVSTGDIFRTAISENTILGVKAKVYIDNGELVPDNITAEVVEHRLKKADCNSGFVLDGFPRTINQADILNNILANINLKLDYVIDISMKKNVLIDRLAARRVCPFCRTSYNVKLNPTKKEGICDICSNRLTQRDDDKIDTAVNRLEVYEKQTAPLIDFYNVRGLLYSVDGDQEIEKVFNDICKILGER